MLDQVQIQGFKAIFDSGPVQLRPLTLLIGRNGSGKSSLLESLQWLQESLFSGLFEATKKRFDSFEDLVNRRAQTIELDLLLNEGPSEVRYRLEVKERAGGDPRPIVASETCREQRRKAAIWTIQTRKGPVGAAVRSLNELGMNPVRDGNLLALAAIETRRKTSGAERLRDFLTSAAFLRLSPTTLAKPDDMARVKGSLIDDDGYGTVALFASLDSEQRGWVVDRIREVLPGARSVSVARYDKRRGYVELKERMISRGGRKIHPIPSWLLSEGTRRLVTLFGLLAVRPRPSLIAVEEIENGLDPWTLNEVFRELREAAEDGVQILLTTHSPFLLDHVTPEEILRVQRRHGNTTFKRVSDFETILKYKDVVAPGAMYLSGFLEDAEDRESPTQRRKPHED